MGTSNWQNISYCVGVLRRLKPASVLDVGTGFGRWGVLCREFLDVWEGREARLLWQTRIEGIEAFPGCLTPLHGYIYDRLHVGDAVEVLPALGVYDVVYLGDVVEHQAKSRAWDLLDEAVRHARQAAIVTIPIGDNWPQEMGWDGNTYHTHRSVWEPEDFDRYPGARRHAFSDFLGRMYLVAELPGGASDMLPRSLPAAPDATIARQVSREDAEPLPSELLDRLDENLSCRALTDNPGLHIDLSGSLDLPAPSDGRDPEVHRAPAIRGLALGSTARGDCRRALQALCECPEWQNARTARPCTSRSHGRSARASGGCAVGSGRASARTP